MLYYQIQISYLPFLWCIILPLVHAGCKLYCCHFAFDAILFGKYPFAGDGALKLLMIAF